MTRLALYRIGKNIERADQITRLPT